MFSARLPSQLDPNPLWWFRSRWSGPPLLDLTVSNPTRVGFELPEEAIQRALCAPGVLGYAPDAQGALPARQAICAYYEQVHAVSVHPDDVFLTASTSEAYGFLLKLLCDPGDRVAVPTPSYPLFDHLVALEGVQAAPYPLRYQDRWWIDLAALEGRLSGARAIVTVSPNNPTGSYLSADELAALEDLALSGQLALVNDEVFQDYPLGPLDADRLTTLAGRDRGPLGFSLGGLSKLLGLPQVKLSWILLSGAPEARAAARARLEIIADTYLSVSAMAQLALPGLLDLRPALSGPIAARIRANHARLLSRLRPPCPVSLLHGEGGWACVLKVPRLQDDDALVMTLAERAGVWVQPGYFFDLPAGHLVLSLLVPEPVMQTGLEAIITHLGGGL